MSSITQENEYGLNIGRDLNMIVNNYQRIDPGKLSLLFDKFEDEYKNDVFFQGIIETLQRYNTPKVSSVIGIEEKLERGGRADLITIGLEAKEQYAKKLLICDLYESAQKINVYLLSLIVTRFRYKVHPSIKEGASNAEVGVLIYEEIVQPLLDLLGNDVIIDFTSEHIEGMLYYLTGNCHINWD